MPSPNVYYHYIHDAPRAEGSNPMTKTTKSYWDKSWRRRSSEPAFRHWSSDLMISGLDRFLSGDPRYRFPEGGTLLEIGCGNSNLLPYFVQRWKLSVEGIDYSEEGCNQARKSLSRYGVPGTVHLGDLFAPPPGLDGRFDAVISSGVVEHFEDQTKCIAAMRAFLGPAGRMITIVPSMCGWMGAITLRMTPEIYAVHVPTSREKLRAAHQAAGLKVLHCDYFLPVHLGVLNLDPIRPRWVRRALGHGANILSKGLNVALSPFFPLLRSRRLSPYVLCIAGNEGDSRRS